MHARLLRCIRTYMHTCSSHTYKQAYLPTDTPTCRRAYKSTYLHTNLHAHMRTFTHTDILNHAYIIIVHTHIRIRITCIPTYIHTCPHTYVCTYELTYLHTYMHTYMQTHLLTYLHQQALVCLSNRKIVDASKGRTFHWKMTNNLVFL